jgi:hypothetical protein
MYHTTTTANAVTVRQTVSLMGLALLRILLAAASVASAAEPPPRPNIVILFVDDKQ